jgi:dienelactone hydrolase
VIDSFKPRGVTTTVANQAAVRDADMLADAVAVLKALAQRPDIDPARIGLIGFSKGGTVAIKAALRHYMRDAGDAKFALLLGLYPWCGEMPMDFSSAGAPLVMLLGANDKYVGTQSCREHANKFQAAGGNLTLHVYDGAGHDWDFPGSTSWTQAQAQNASKCIYEEVERGKWIERSTKLVTFENGAPTANAKKARAACMTLGASGGYNAAAAKRSWQDIESATRAAFKL